MPTPSRLYMYRQHIWGCNTWVAMIARLSVLNKGWVLVIRYSDTRVLYKQKECEGPEVQDAWERDLRDTPIRTRHLNREFGWRFSLTGSSAFQFWLGWCTKDTLPNCGVAIVGNNTARERARDYDHTSWGFYTHTIAFLLVPVRLNRGIFTLQSHIINSIP